MTVVLTYIITLSTHYKYLEVVNNNKPENPFQNYDLAKKLLEAQKKFFCIEIFWYNHQKYKNRKPDRKPDQPEIFMDEPVWEYKFACIKIFSTGPTMFKWYHIAPRRRTTTTK